MQILRFFLGLAAIGLLIFLGLKLINLIVFILISLVISLILMPLVDFVCDLKIYKFSPPRGLVSIISILLFFSLIIGAFSIFIPSVAKEVEFLSDISQEQVQENVDFLLNAAEDIVSNYEKIAGLEQGESLEKIKQYATDTFLSIVSFKGISDFFNQLISALGTALIALFSIIFITYYFLKERNLVSTFINDVTPESFLPHVKSILNKMRNLLSRYFIGILIEMFFMALIVTAGLYLLGIRNFVLIGIFVAVINVIPYLGPSIGAAFGVVITIVSSIHDPSLVSIWPEILKVVSVVAVAQIIDNTVLQPQIYSKSVAAHPLEIFLVIIAAGTLYGIGGMILAVPAYTVIRIVLKEFLSGYKSVAHLTRNI
ncbi:MAG: AI-2E family transporter [Luteibaculaceae bacterium]